MYSVLTGGDRERVGLVTISESRVGMTGPDTCHVPRPELAPLFTFSPSPHNTAEGWCGNIASFRLNKIKYSERRHKNLLRRSD